MENPSDYFARNRQAWDQYDPSQHLPPYHDPTWPQLLPPIKRSDVDPIALWILQSYGGRPIPPRIQALATQPLSEGPQACEALEKEKLLSKPLPRFHDLRHTWRTNARRSGIDSQIAVSILGYSNRTLSVSERYGVISPEEKVNTIDRLKFDFGPTTIWVASEAGF